MTNLANGLWMKKKPLMYDFISLTTKNAEEGTASICFLISLNEYDETATTSFQLKLLKDGSIISSEFEAPQTIYKMEEVERGYDTAELRLFHQEASELQLDSSYYNLEVTYESFLENVSIPKIQNFLGFIVQGKTVIRNRTTSFPIIKQRNYKHILWCKYSSVFRELHYQGHSNTQQLLI